MTYQLGVDLGTTYSAAAIGRDGRVEVTTLGTANPVMPSVVLLRADGEVLTGETAVRRGLSEPTRVAREFKRRLGDPTPLVLGGTPYGAEALMAHLLRGIVDTISEREGGRPDRVVLTHPANYGPYKIEQMREVARSAGLDLATTEFLTEPQAAAISYATRNRVEPGEVVAVYDFGGGTLDIALVQRDDSGFRLIGRPEGMERFGGIDIDAAIVAFVDTQLDGAIAALDPNDPAVQAAVARLRDDCRSAKEALSGDTDTSISVSLPGLQTNVRLTRAELEDMVRPRIVETVESLDRAVRSAGLTFDRVSRVLLVGGSSRMPLVGEMIRQRTGRPISVDAHPKFAIALGAAAFGATHATGSTPRVNPTPPPPPAAAPSPGAPTTPPPPARQATPTAPPPPAAAAAQTFTPVTAPVTKSTDTTKLYIAIGALAAVVLAIIGFVVLRGGGDDGTATTATDDTTVETDPPSTDAPTTDAPNPDPTVAPVETAAPVAAPTPLSDTELVPALVDPSDMNPAAGWAITPTDTSGDPGLCGQVNRVQPVATITQTLTRTDPRGNPQFLTNTLESYTDTATANATFQETRSVMRSCGSFVFTNDAGTSFDVSVETFDTTPSSGCQAALDLRFTATFSGTTDIAFTSVRGITVCANNATSVSLDTVGTSVPGEETSEWRVAEGASVTRLLTLRQVP